MMRLSESSECLHSTAEREQFRGFHAAKLQRIWLISVTPPLNSVKGEELISGGKNFVGGFGIINIKIYPTIEKICYLCSPFVLFVGAWG